ncbi:hypothetical protein RGQ29_028363 [Quercus rubra]|uniref:Uncharacterized protein n=1 Tax=Quercus rubra TaxID=3512 RepID=A0AAN7ERK1_QUERU|nr:hypothetical protein RGQ29_028363 [Quercus rubra]
MKKELHCAATKCFLSQSLNEMEDEIKNNPITDSQNGVVVDDEDDDTPTLSSETLAEQNGPPVNAEPEEKEVLLFL